jgi:hypothetical protein
LVTWLRTVHITLRTLGHRFRLMRTRLILRWNDSFDKSIEMLRTKRRSLVRGGDHSENIPVTTRMIKGHHYLRNREESLASDPPLPCSQCHPRQSEKLLPQPTSKPAERERGMLRGKDLAHLPEGTSHPGFLVRLSARRIQDPAPRTWKPS